MDNEDLNRVIMGGPWFIGPYYLTMRRWEPNFDLEEAIRTTTTTTVWARLPNLSVDYYDPTTLQKIGNKVGPLLKVDAHTTHHTRGQYARVCVQIDLAQPIAKYVKIGKKKQRVIYEGVSALCFHYGRIGHRNNQCSQLNATSEMVKEAANPMPLSTHASSSTSPSWRGADPKGDLFQTCQWWRRYRQIPKQRMVVTPMVQLAKAPLVDFSKPEPKTQQWVNKTSSKAQGPPKSITIQEPKSKSKNSLTQALPTHQSIVSKPNPSSVTQKLSIPHQDPTISSPISVQPNHITPIHSTSTSTSGIDPQTPLSQNSTQPLLNHGSISDSATRSENPNVFSKGTIDHSDGDSHGVDTGLLIPQGIQMVTESIVHSVESPHSHGHEDEPPRDGSLDPPSRGKFRFKRVMSDWEFRIDKRHHYTRRGVEPYQAPAIDKFGLPKPLEVCPNRGENGTHPPDIESPMNCRGAPKVGFRKCVMDLKRIHNPTKLLILETKISSPNAQDVADSLGFPKSYIVNSDGLAKGLWLLWDDSRISVDILSTNNQAIHAVIQFPLDVIKLIMSAISSTSISILINGDKAEEFCPSQGIRQGDSLSPYIFILCMEYLSIRISADMDAGLSKGSKVGRRGPFVSHIFFVDDIIFIGRTTFAKSILASIPNYYMQSSMLPAFTLKEFDQISHNFIWGSEVEQKKIHLVNWNIVSSPKHLGGLGLKSAKEVNLVAMCKLNSRLHQEKDKVWSGIFTSKYNIQDCHTRPVDTGSPIWKAIIKGYDFFSSGDHAFELISYYLPDDISNRLKAIPLPIFNDREDSFAWKGTSRGTFTATSTYYLLKNPFTFAEKEWDWIWKLPTIPKIQHFFCLLAHQRLKCFSFLHHLSIASTAMCPRCQDEEETVEHLIRLCPSSTLKTNVLNIPWNTLFCFAIWGVWLQHNQTVHSPQPFQLNNLQSSIIERAAEFWASAIPKATCIYHEENFKWAKPPPNVIKLNMDGSAKGNPGILATGGIFHDHHGNWKFGYARKIDWSNSLAAELWAIRDGLQLAITHNFFHIIVESDSLVAIQLLQEPPPTSHNLSAIIFDCRELLRQISLAELKHIVREPNMAADQMAELGHGIDHDFVTFESIPLSVKQYCIANIMGIEFPLLGGLGPAGRW
ncbi:hypothetical protein SLEP1_g40137 [Rubroshorea leprosula]|uniref:Reverse transcriptase n=1 Tax=Rubroshorea leprosula TaxID=152421 RepID=A0AAV5L3U8_9ROSI|nr:hypothetical protein SLEP1_g40137 [Rubroshorea leprosula]